MHEHLIPQNCTLEDKIPSLHREDKERFLTFVRQMLQWLPEDRKTAKELLQDPWFGEVSVEEA